MIASDIELLDIFECCEVMKSNKEECIFYRGHNGYIVMHSMKTGLGLNLYPVNYCHNCGKKIKLFSDMG